MEEQPFLQWCQGQYILDGSVLWFPPLDLARGKCDKRCIGRSESLHFWRRNMTCQSELLDGLMLKDIARCEEQAGAACTAHQLDGEDAVAAEGEEVIMDADAGQAQDLGKERA